MPLICEQFIASMTKLLLASPGIEKLVSMDDLHYLLHIRLTADKEELLRTTLNDTVGAVSCIKPIIDEYNRDGVWNHTIIFKLRDYFNITQPTSLFTDAFIKSSENMPEKLGTLKLKENVNAFP